MSLSTHVLDTAAGKPVSGLTIHCEHYADGWQRLRTARTDADGRVRDLLNSLTLGTYRLIFEIGAEAFFPEVVITFGVSDPAEHHHVPLLLGPFAYTTYRGS